MSERAERELELLPRLAIGRARRRLFAGLLAEGDRLVPHLASQRVVRELLDVLGEPLGVERLDRLHDACMQRPAALPEQAPVGDLVRERVLERVL